MISRDRTRTTRRHLLGGLVTTASLAAAGSLLQACGGGAPAQTSAPATTPATTSTRAPSAATAAPSAKAGLVKISYWGSFGGDNGKAEQEIVNRFNKSQDKIALDYQFQGSYEQTAQKLSAALAAKQAPTVSLLSDVWWQKFWLDKLLVAANPFMSEAKVKPTDYVDSFINEGTRSGNVYWIPFARSTPLFYYNKDLFSKAGFDHAPETWDDLVNWADKLVQREGDKLKVSAFAHANGSSYIAWVFQPVVWQYGGRYSDDNDTITIDQPPAIDAGQFYSDTVWKYKFASTPKDITVDFPNGLTASMLASTASLGQIERTSKFAVGTAFLPKKKQFGCCTGGAGMGILATSSPEQQAAGFQWINFATGVDSTTYWAQTTGYMPVRKQAIDSDQMKQFYQKHPNFETAVKQLPKTQPQDWARVGIPNGDQIIGKGLERIVIGHETVPTVMKDVADTLRKEGAPVLKQLRALGQLK